MSRFSGQPRKRKGVIALDVALHENPALLAFFKYYEFLILGLESLASAAGLDTGILRHALPSMEILHPVGLLFTRSRGCPTPSIITAARTSPRARFWTCCCSCPSSPRFMAGPIMRARQFLPQLGHRTWDSRDLQEGCPRLSSAGCSARPRSPATCPSISCATCSNRRNFTPRGRSSPPCMPTPYRSSVDFSGYSDMAIGAGRLMGFRLPENFRSPYLALNIQDFWRRWHITLSLWLRDYLYIPLGGSRRGNRYLNLIITHWRSAGCGTRLEYPFSGLGSHAWGGAGRRPCLP